MVPSVLVIDRDVPSAKLARVVLEADGWQVMHVHDIDQALACLSLLRPHLILTALDLPLDAALASVHRLDAAVPELPIVAVTTNTAPEAELSVLAAGCASVLYKPIDVETFATQLRAFLPGDHR